MKYQPKSKASTLLEPYIVLMNQNRLFTPGMTFVFPNTEAIDEVDFECIVSLVPQLTAAEGTKCAAKGRFFDEVDLDSYFSF